jgi:uncharacterized protein
MNNQLATIQAIYEAFGKGDVPTILSYLDEGVEWEAWPDNYAQKSGVPWLITRKGVEDTVEFFKVVGQMKFNQFQVKNLMAGGNQVAADIFVEVEIPWTGAHVTDEEMHLWDFNDAGKVIRFRHYCDTAKHIKAAGLTM